jgi:hypothetical protein
MNSNPTPAPSSPTPNSNSAGSNHRTGVWIAIIGALQAIVVSIITMVAQYNMSVAPLKKEVDELRAQPLRRELKIPSGNLIGFKQLQIFSSELWKTPKWGYTNEAWDKKCRTWAAAALARLNFKLVKIDAEHAVRGEREGIHVGVECTSAFKLATVYSVVMRADEERLQHYFGDVLDALSDISDGDLKIR